MEHHEIIVIGAGPAGASAAKVLQELGRDFLLLDRFPFPRNKPCAGVLPPKVKTILDMPDAVIERPLLGYRIHPPSGNVVPLKAS